VERSRPWIVGSGDNEICVEVDVLPLIRICAPRRVFPVVADATFPSAGPNFYQTERQALKRTLSGRRKECGAVAGPHIFPLRPSSRQL
jgi:hypothetical protein